MTMSCESGSVPMPDAEWLVATVTAFHESYGSLHPYIAIFLCIAGTIMNIITVIVLTRPSMVSPVNMLLCAVAVCDIIVMSSMLIFVWHFHVGTSDGCDPTVYSYGWLVFTMIHAHITVTFHATSIWLTVSLAQIRVLTISRATKAPTINITIKFTICLAICTYVIVSCINMPNIFAFDIVELDASDYMSLSCLQFNADVNDTTTAITFVYSYQSNDCFITKIAFWSNGMMFKVVPCFMLTISIMALVKLIADVGHRRRSLAQVMKKKQMPKDHTTPMLVAVLTIFLIAELPQGVLSVLIGIYSPTFRQKIYSPLGDFMDLLSLLNSAVNFLIYCAMSRKFRLVFLRLFVRCIPSLDEDASIWNDEARSRRPSRITDMTRTEQVHKVNLYGLQLALTSHRPSAVSMLINMATRSELDTQQPSPRSQELLSVGDYYRQVAPKPNRRVSFDQNQLIEHSTANGHGRWKRHVIDITIDEASYCGDLSSTANGHHAVYRNKTNRRFSTDSDRIRRLFNVDPIAKLRILFSTATANGENHLLESSPQRRMNLIRVESNGFAY